MPIYEYQCPNCSKIDEDLVLSGDQVGTMFCDECQVGMSRVLSVCSIKFRGTGWSFDGYEDRPWGKKPYHRAVKEDGYIPGSYVKTGKPRFRTNDSD